MPGAIGVSIINGGNYDLAVTGESHNFRNNSKGKHGEEGIIVRMSPCERLMEHIIKQGLKTKILLISATPVNASLMSTRNQLYFLTDGRRPPGSVRPAFCPGASAPDSSHFPTCRLLPALSNIS